MKNFYDKLLLLLAILALLGGVAFYMLKAESPSDEEARPSLQAAENPYDPIPVPDTVAEPASWPAPGAQSSGPDWVYDVFTPPMIYIDEDGNFIPEPPRDPTKTEPYGLYLAEMEREPYRIQMQGFSGDRDKPEEAVLFFFDEERQLRFFIREGQTNEESEVEVLDFSIEREIDEDNNVEVTAIATILDKRTGEEIELNDEERLLNPEMTLVFRSEEDPEVKVELTILPDDPVTRFTTSAGEFILQEINLEDRTVTVEKKATEVSEARTRTLSPPPSTQPKRSEEEEEKEEEEAPSGGEVDFDFGF